MYPKSPGCEPGFFILGGTLRSWMERDELGYHIFVNAMESGPDANGRYPATNTPTDDSCAVYSQSLGNFGRRKVVAGIELDGSRGFVNCVEHGERCKYLAPPLFGRLEICQVQDRRGNSRGSPLGRKSGCNYGPARVPTMGMESVCGRCNGAAIDRWSFRRPFGFWNPLMLYPESQYFQKKFLPSISIT